MHKITVGALVTFAGVIALLPAPAAALQWTVSGEDRINGATFQGTFDVQPNSVSDLTLEVLVSERLNRAFTFTTVSSLGNRTDGTITYVVANNPNASVGLTFTPALDDQASNASVFFAFTALSSIGTTAYQAGTVGTATADPGAVAVPEPASVLGVLTSLGLLRFAKARRDRKGL